MCRPVSSFNLLIVLDRLQPPHHIRRYIGDPDESLPRSSGRAAIIVTIPQPSTFFHRPIGPPGSSTNTHWPARLLTVLTSIGPPHTSSAPHRSPSIPVAHLYTALPSPSSAYSASRRHLIGHSSTPVRPRLDFSPSSPQLATRPRTGLLGSSLGPVQSRHDFFWPHPGSHGPGPLPRPRRSIGATSSWLPLASSQLSWPQSSYPRPIPVHNPSGMHLRDYVYLEGPAFGLRLHGTVSVAHHSDHRTDLSTASPRTASLALTLRRGPHGPLSALLHHIIMHLDFHL